MATHSSILTWRITWTEEPGWLQSTAYPGSDEQGFLLQPGRHRRHQQGRRHSNRHRKIARFPAG